MTTDEHGLRARSGRWLNQFGPFLILVFVTLLFIGLLAWRDATEKTDGLQAFLSFATFKTVLTQTVVVAIGALGMTMIIVSGGIDLSVGSAVALTSVLGALLTNKGAGLPAVIAVTILAGGLVGLLNGAIIAGFRLMPFIVTLGMLGVGRGLAKWLAKNQTVNFLSDSSLIGVIIADPDPLGKMPPPGVWVAIAFARAMKVLIYGLAGLFFGLAGVMMLSRLRQGDPTAAIGLELDVIAAVVIGGASLNGGTGSILGSMIGALTMAVLRTGSQYMDWPNYMQEIIIGVLIILAVGLDKLRQSRASQ
ncbi:MAG: ABC transporter permease [Verrucomicrobia bacterium]|nr:ABC transporter permease [Verrucomicrobiota bacterium]